MWIIISKEAAVAAAVTAVPLIAAAGVGVGGRCEFTGASVTDEFR